MYICRSMMVLLLINFLAANALGQTASGAEREVCGQNTFKSIPGLIAKIDAATEAGRESRSRRSRPARIKQFFDAADTTDLDSYIGTYIRALPHSAFLLYVIDGNDLCIGLWSLEPYPMDVRRPHLAYALVPQGASMLDELAKELAFTMGVSSTWQTRSGDVSPTSIEKKKRRSVSAITADLSRLLFPLDGRIVGSPLKADSFEYLLRTVRHLTILPAKGISGIPIAMLEPFGDGRSSIEFFSINFMASLNDIKRGAEPWPRRFASPLLVGNPRPSSDAKYKWSPLPGAEAEVLEIKKIINGEILINEKATRSAVLEKIPNNDFIHIAAHGYSDPHDPIDGSFIMLGDGRLTAREVQELTLAQRPLVALSACHSGEGGILEFGITGLARAFQIAGASNTLMSLWAVDDNATKELMVEFTKQLAGAQPSDALRASMLVNRKAFQDPTRWAAFNMFGNHSRSP